MTLKVTPGTLRAEGPGFIPATHFKQFVQTTDISNFGPEEFSAAANRRISFVFSQTEPPATNSRQRSLLWFKRGEGRLYVWDTAWQATNDSLPLGHWVSASDRRDILTRWYNGDDSAIWNANGIPFGLFGVQGEASAVSNNTAQHGGMRRHVPNTHFAQQRWGKCVVHMTNVTLPPLQETFVVCAEMGYTWAGVHTNASGPTFAWMSASDYSGMNYLISAQAHAPYDAHTTQLMIGHITSSGPASAYSAADTVSRMMVFLKPQAARDFMS